MSPQDAPIARFVRRHERQLVVIAAAAATAAALSGCASDTGPAGSWRADPGPPGAVAAELGSAVTIDSDEPAELALIASQTMFASAPAVVLVGSGDPDATTAAAGAALELDGPVLEVGSAISDDGLRMELERLSTTAVLVVGDVPDAEIEAIAPDAAVAHLRSTWAAGTPSGDKEVTEALAGLPALGKPQLAAETVALIDPESDEDVTLALATVRAAGAIELEIPGGDPRATHETVQAVASAQPLTAIGVGATFGSTDQLAARFRSAVTGVELPGGGQIAATARYVGLYGSPVDTGLGPLGWQGADAAVERAEAAAAAYGSPDSKPVVPTLEVAATVASSSAGEDGNYSTETPVEDLKPLVEQATAAGDQVVLTFQPGAATFAEQVVAYEDLLQLPDVGVSFDLERRYVSGYPGTVGPGSVPLTEVEDGLDEVARLVHSESLPQKLVVLRTMPATALADPGALDRSRPEVALVVSTPEGVVGEAWDSKDTGSPALLRGQSQWMPASGVPSPAAADAPEYVIYR